MSQFIVHTVPASPFARAVCAAFIEKGASFRLAPFAAGEQRSPAHLARHPFGRMPVLEHDGFMLYETQAILRYLDRVLPEPPLTPADPQAAARMDQVLNICDWYLFQGVSNVIAFQRIVRPRFKNEPADEAAIAEAMPKARVVFGELSRLLADKPYFAGSELSLADLHVAPQMSFLAQTPEWQPLTEKAANLASWLQRVNARPSFTGTTWERMTELAKVA